MTKHCPKLPSSLSPRSFIPQIAGRQIYSKTTSEKWWCSFLKIYDGRLEMSSHSFSNLGVSSVPKFIWNHEAQIRRCPRDWFLQYRAYLPWASAGLADPVTRSLTLQNHETIPNDSELLLKISSQILLETWWISNFRRFTTWEDAFNFEKLQFYFKINPKKKDNSESEHEYWPGRQCPQQPNKKTRNSF